MADKRSSFSLSEEDKKAGISFSYPTPEYFLSAIAGALKYGQEKVDSGWCAGVVVKAADYLRRYFKGWKPEDITEDAIMAALEKWTPGEMRATLSPEERLAKAMKISIDEATLILEIREKQKAKAKK